MDDRTAWVTFAAAAPRGFEPNGKAMKHAGEFAVFAAMYADSMLAEYKRRFDKEQEPDHA